MSSHKYKTFVFVTDQPWSYSPDPNIVRFESHFDSTHNMILAIITLNTPITLKSAYKQFGKPGVFMIPMLSGKQYDEYSRIFFAQPDVIEQERLYEKWFKIDNNM